MGNIRLKEEEIIQIQVVEWIKQCTTLPVVRIKNEGKISHFQRNLDERMGIHKGALDLLIPRNNGQYPGLWLELKSPRGVLSKEQKEFIKKMLDEGYQAVAKWSSESAIEFIKIHFRYP